MANTDFMRAAQSDANRDASAIAEYARRCAVRPGVVFHPQATAVTPIRSPFTLDDDLIEAVLHEANKRTDTPKPPQNAARLLLTLANHYGLQDSLALADGIEGMVVGAMADILHMIDLLGMDHAEVCEMAAVHHLQESAA